MLTLLAQSGQVTHLEWYLRLPWPHLAIAALMAVAIAYVIVLYRRETMLTPRRRVLLGAFRAALYCLLILLVFEPMLAVEQQVQLRRNVLVLIDTSASMDIADARTAAPDAEAAAKAMGKISYQQPSAGLGEEARRQASAKRIDLARAVLENAELNLPAKLGAENNLRYFTFGEQLSPMTGKGETLPEALGQAKAKDQATRLGTAITQAVGRFGGQPIAGVIVLTDGASNDGMEPLEVARRMKDQLIPLLPVGIGLPRPPDVKVGQPIVADTVFMNDRVTVHVPVSSTGYAGQSVTISLKVDKVELDSKMLALDDKTHYVELTFEPKAKADPAQLEVSVTPLPGEVSLENNAASKPIRIIDDKIKVLYVEGKPRWEYRYLRRVLLRDHRLDVKFLMTEGDRDLAERSEHHIVEFPSDPAKAFDYDLVILGDVPASYFSRTQLTRIEELVRQRSGSLLMLGGQEHAPVSYINTPIEQVLPVKLNAEGWRKVDDAVYPKLTEAGLRGDLMVLDLPEDRNAQLWSVVHPMYKLPVIDSAKGGATVLAELSSASGAGEAYPLISWQRYGNGKSMLICTDQLWRLRFKKGDQYHARLWGQTIQFLTLSRLLGGNKRINLEIESTQFTQGQRVAIAANVLNEAYEPVKAASFLVEVKSLDQAGPPVKLALEALPGMPGMFQGYFNAEKPGRYEARPPDDQAKDANSVIFQVAPAALEQREPGMQEELLKKMAELSGGQYFGLAELPGLTKALTGQQRTATIRNENELWDHWAVLLVVLALAGTEWFLRRRFDLI